MGSPTIIILLAAFVQEPVWREVPSLPVRRANNAVAAMETMRGPALFSFLGLDSTKRWSGVRNDAYRWNMRSTTWQRIAAVPGPGRLAATAQVVRGRIYVIGGYTVAADGSEKSLPHLEVYDPDRDRWSRGAPMPIPVDDAVSGVWRDSLIFLVSGWHDRDNVANVQIYDPWTDSWQHATPIPGPPVFGHSGALAENSIVYVDGVRTNVGSPRFGIESSSWIGEIDPTAPSHITWKRLPQHPGPPLYRAAAGALGHRIVIAGGTDNPYNYDGVGYDGNPAEPLDAVFAYDLTLRGWVSLPPLSVPTMDHRGLVVIDGRLLIAGGMVAGQQVTDRVVAGAATALSPRR